MKRYIKAAEGLSLEDKQDLARTSADPKELAQLANDEDVEVREGVANNPNTPPDVLAQLANDEYYCVCLGAAANLNTPADVLAQLAHDTDRDVRETARNNPNCPVKSKKSNKWPSADAWYSIDSDEQFENMWSRYLAGPEDEVNKQLQIFPEPSIQGVPVQWLSLTNLRIRTNLCI